MLFMEYLLCLLICLGMSYLYRRIFFVNFSNDICSDNKTLICPVCDYCEFIKLSSSCLYARFTHIFDNYATIFFACAMSIWSTLFLEGK